MRLSNPQVPQNIYERLSNRYTELWKRKKERESLGPWRPSEDSRPADSPPMTASLPRGPSGFPGRDFAIRTREGLSRSQVKAVSKSFGKVNAIVVGASTSSTIGNLEARALKDTRAKAAVRSPRGSPRQRGDLEAKVDAATSPENSPVENSPQVPRDVDFLPPKVVLDGPSIDLFGEDPKTAHANSTRNDARKEESLEPMGQQPNTPPAVKFQGVYDRMLNDARVPEAARDEQSSDAHLSSVAGWGPSEVVQENERRAEQTIIKEMQEARANLAKAMVDQGVGGVVPESDLFKANELLVDEARQTESRKAGVAFGRKIPTKPSRKKMGSYGREDSLTVNSNHIAHAVEEFRGLHSTVKLQGKRYKGKATFGSDFAKTQQMLQHKRQTPRGNSGSILKSLTGTQKLPSPSQRLSNSQKVSSAWETPGTLSGDTNGTNSRKILWSGVNRKKSNHMAENQGKKSNHPEKNQISRQKIKSHGKKSNHMKRNQITRQKIKSQGKKVK